MKLKHLEWLEMHQSKVKNFYKIQKNELVEQIKLVKKYLTIL